MAQTLAPAKRLARDLKTLYTQPLPLYYLWADASNPTGSLNSLDILLAGPSGTPYANGVFKLHLDIPAGYPILPPRAFFRTKIFHPNVEPTTGAVCLETLKRDWRSDLTLVDVLATIACLLIQPNPDSALNEEAGRMIHDGFDRFTAHARLMASIHAKVPAALRAAVDEAVARGEEKSRSVKEGDENADNAENAENENDENSENSENYENSYHGENAEEDDSMEDKENDASLSPTPVTQSPPLPIRIGVKRPLGDLPTPVADDKENDFENDNEKNIAANVKNVDLSAPSAHGAKPIPEPVKRQGLTEMSNRQVRLGMPPPAKKQATARARVGIRRL